MSISATDLIAAEELARRFTYHAPKGDQPERYEKLRQSTKALAERFVASCPDSRELELAIEYLETAVFWANAAIARNE